jgi:hypothetical protein
MMSGRSLRNINEEIFGMGLLGQIDGSGMIIKVNLTEIG